MYFFKQFFSGIFITIVMTGLDQDMSEDTTAAVQVGVEALKLLIQADREKAAAQK